ncbi:MAG: threonine/serine exporter family protein [Sarcina sp.]
MTDLVQIISSTIGTLGFALLFNIKKEKLPTVTLGGFFTMCIYVLCRNLGLNLILSNGIATVCITFYSEILARKMKTPSTVFLFPGIIPLAPGGSLYYTINSFILGRTEELNQYSTEAIQTAIGIALGVLITSLFVRQLNERIKREKMKF